MASTLNESKVCNFEVHISERALHLMMYDCPATKDLAAAEDVEVMGLVCLFCHHHHLDRVREGCVRICSNPACHCKFEMDTSWWGNPIASSHGGTAMEVQGKPYVPKTQSCDEIKQLPTLL